MRALAVVVLLAALSGCAAPASPAGEPPAEGAAEPPPSPPFVTYTLHNTTLASVYANPILPDRWGSLGLGFRTDRNTTTAVLAELVWNDTAQDLDARLEADVRRCPWEDNLDWAACHASMPLGDGGLEFGVFQNAQGVPGQGDSPSRAWADGERLLQVLDACSDPCNWTGYAWARTPIANIEWTLYVTVFEGPVPDGFTAIPS